MTHRNLAILPGRRRAQRAKLIASHTTTVVTLPKGRPQAAAPAMTLAAQIEKELSR
jgi:hypothetical protein